MSEDVCSNIAVADILHLVVLGPGMREQYCPVFDEGHSLTPVLICS